MLNVFVCILGEPLVKVHHDSKDILQDMEKKLVDAFDIWLSDRVAAVVEKIN